jgi:hypothetical protein
MCLRASVRLHVDAGDVFAEVWAPMLNVGVGRGELNEDVDAVVEVEAEPGVRPCHLEGVWSSLDGGRERDERRGEDGSWASMSDACMGVGGCSENDGALLMRDVRTRPCLLDVLDSDDRLVCLLDLCEFIPLLYDNSTASSSEYSASGIPASGSVRELEDDDAISEWKDAARLSGEGDV